MLLCLSSCAFCVGGHTKVVIDFADDIAFQAANDLALAFTLSGAFDDVALCGLMIAHSGYSDDVEGCIGFSVATTVQTHAIGFAA